MKKFSLAAFALVVPVLALANQISPELLDAKGTNASKAVQYLVDQGVVEGYEDGTFKPEQDINRAEFLKIVLESSEKDSTTCDSIVDYDDVRPGQWFYNIICQATKKGIVQGYPDGSFKPGDTINFAEASKIIAKVKEVEVEEEDSAEWFKPFTQALGRERIVPGSVSDIAKKISRGEMAQMIWGIDTGNEVGESDLVLPKIESCEALNVQMKKFQKRQGQGMYGRNALFMDDAMDMEMMESDMPAMARSEGVTTQSSIGGGGSEKFSTTNIQEFGVDEADIIKNDGSHIYMIKENAVRIVKAFPSDQMKEVANLSVADKGFWPREMYVDGDILTIVGQTNSYNVYPAVKESMPLEEELEWEDPEFFDDADIFLDDSAEDARLIESRAEVALMVMPGMPYPGGTNKQLTTLISFDISDRSNPTEIRKVSLEGNYTQSRKIGDVVYLVTNKYQNWYWGRPVPMLRNTDLPIMEDSANASEKMIAPCQDIHYFPNFEDSNFLIIGAINTKDTSEKVGRIMMLGSGNQIYASTNNLYVTRTKHKERFITGRSWDGWQWNPVTEIYKFALDENNIDFVAKGEVDGSVLNQFSMSEQGDYFRIATQMNQEGSMMNILDKNLKLTGKVDGVAPGENIKSVRFMGNKGYMVTFKNVDPLFVIDLNPTNPKVLGELKIPGWSDYLHPYDENHLIGLGKEVKEGAEEDDRLSPDEVLGVKLAIFDVSNVNNPKEIHKKVIGDTGSYSEVLNNHKALLFDKAEGIMALPITVMTKDGAAQNGYQPARQSYNGAFVYDVSLEEGFQLKGKATHYSDDYWSDKNTRRWGNHEYNIQRIIYIGDNFFTISPNVIEAHTWSDVEEVNRLKLDKKACNQIYDEMECRENTQCRVLWREWNECYEDSEDFSKVCEERKEFMRCEAQ